MNDFNAKYDATIKQMAAEFPVLQWFRTKHLKEEQVEVVQLFGALAMCIAKMAPQNLEKQVSLRKLLEAKDAAVRATLYRDFQPNRDLQLTASDETKKLFSNQEKVEPTITVETDNPPTTEAEFAKQLEKLFPGAKITVVR